MLLNQLWQTDNELQDTNKHKDHKIHKVLLASTKKSKHGYRVIGFDWTENSQNNN